MILLDASVAVKWYVRESNSFGALAILRDHQRNIAVPGLFLSEVIGVLVRRANADKSLRPESEASIAKFLTLIDEGVIVAHHLAAATVADASRLALDLGHPLKDCLYLALALELACPLITGDARFAKKATAVYEHVQMLAG